MADHYSNYITYLASNDINQVVYNPDRDHAVLVMEKLFDRATKIVRIYTGCFSGEISGDKRYQYALDHLLRRNVHVKILCQDKIFEKNSEPEVFKILRYHYIIRPELIEIKHHPFLVKQNDVEVHFATADDKMYRIEEDIELFSAKCNFNDPDECKIWNQKFDTIFDNSRSKTIHLFEDEHVIAGV